MLEDPETLPVLRAYVPHGDPPPAPGSAARPVFDGAVRVMTMAAGEKATLPVAFTTEQRIPVTVGDMVAWSVSETSGRTIDFSAQLEAVDKPPETVVPSAREASHRGVYTSWSDGELVLQFDNSFSWVRHKEVEIYTYTQDEYDYFDDDGMDDDEMDSNREPIPWSAIAAWDTPPDAPPPPARRKQTDAPLTQGLAMQLNPAGPGIKPEPEPEPEPQPADKGPAQGADKGPAVKIAAGPLREAIMRRDLRSCCKIITTPMLANLAWEPKKGFVLLHIAAFENATAFGQWLLKKGALVDVRSAHGVTPLFAAAAHGHLDMVKLLVEHGANTEHAVRSMRPIDVAVQKGKAEVVEFLRSAGSVAEDTAAGGGGGNGSEKDNEAANQGAGPVLDSSVSVLEAQARAYNITAGVPAPTLAPVEEGREVRSMHFTQSHAEPRGALPQKVSRVCRRTTIRYRYEQRVTNTSS